MRLWFLCFRNRSNIVVIELNWFRNELFDLNNFLYHFRKGNVLRLYCRISNYILLRAFLDNYTIIQTKHASQLGFKVILISLNASIIVSSYNKLRFSFINQESILSHFQVIEDTRDSFSVSFT